MKKTLIAATALTLASAAFSAPAHAQLLGGGGLGGTIGGTVGSVSDVAPTVRGTTSTIRSTTNSAVRGSARTEGSQSVDRRSGRVEANRSADGNVTGSVTQLATTPIGAVGGSATGEGSASGNGNAESQLIGTDAARRAAQQTVGQARNLAAPLVQQARQAPGAATNTVGGMGSASGEGSASGSGNGSVNLAGSTLAAAGSVAAAGQGMTAISPGMPVIAPNGEQLGRVRQVIANNRGRVQQVLVENRNGEFFMPAGNLTASGNALFAGSGSASGGTQPTEDQPVDGREDTAQ